ncbi:MAG TPA: hypothetical protein VE130_10545 [Nitrososphaeraceae archaeon]|nr:hypothetical protein [Nitrososphaeraceae archaeon]
MSTRFVPPKDRKTLVQQVPEALRRKKLACSMISQSYIPNRTTDKNALETSVYAQRYPQNVRKRLLTLCRAKIRPDQFEINENLDIQTDGKVTEALVYGVSILVDYPGDPIGTNVLSHCSEVNGVYQRPWAQLTRDDLGNVTDSDIKFWKWMFYIPFNEENVKKVLDEFKGEYRDLALGYAREAGDHWYGDRVFHCKNLEEFISAPFEDVISANTEGYLRTEAHEGVELYQKNREEKRKQMESQLKEFRRGGNVNSSSTNKKQ